MTVLDPDLYKKAVSKVTRSYGTQTSAYRSMAIVKAYKALGGRYSKKKKGTDLARWRKERWIQVVPYVSNQRVKKCGSSDRRRHACRPLIRVTKSTPITLGEAVSRHGKSAVEKLARKKRAGSEKIRIDWIKGRVV